jgi:hypothetical protein
MAETPLTQLANNSSLGKIDETLLWSDAYTWEPKYAYHFVLLIENVPAYLIQASDKPSIENGEVTIDHINVQRKMKGKSKWSDISMTLYDPVIPSGAQAVMDWVRRHHESATGRDGYSTYYKKDLKLQQLSPLGEIIETWDVKGAYIKSATFGKNDWTSEEIMKIELTIAYDWAFLN